MIAVVVIPPSIPEMLSLDHEQSRALLPLGDRPILQHIVESLVTQGIHRIEVLVGHAPEKTEALLVDGVRWGCSFRYHLIRHEEYPYRTLKLLTDLQTESWVLLHADRFPCSPLPTNVSKPQLLVQGTPASNSTDVSSGKCDWGGVAVFPPGDFCKDISALNTPDLSAHLTDMASRGEADVIATSDWMDASTPARLLATQAKILTGKLEGLTISGVEREPGIWISRNVRIHPSAQLIAPLYIGPNCRVGPGVRLGPDVALSGNCIVDSGTVVEHSLALAGSYIGERLELSRTIVDHDLLINVRLGTKVNIGENFLLGSIEQRGLGHLLWIALQSVVAAVLLLLFLPVLLVSWLYFALVRQVSYASASVAYSPLARAALSPATFKLPCIGQDAWSTHRRAGWTAFTRQFLPGFIRSPAGAAEPGRLTAAHSRRTVPHAPGVASLVHSQPLRPH